MAEDDRGGAICLVGRASLAVDAVDSTLWLAWTQRGLARADWCAAGDAWPGLDGSHADAVQEVELPQRYAPVAAYLRDGSVDLADLPVDLEGTDFQLRVWRALRGIAPGRLRTYAGLADEVGSPRATRAVGMANARNPLPVIIPCHRVVETGHRLGGYSGGLQRKRYLLIHEGAQVDGDQVRPGQLQLL